VTLLSREQIIGKEKPVRIGPDIHEHDPSGCELWSGRRFTISDVGFEGIPQNGIE